MSKFVQIVEIQTSRIDELRALGDEFETSSDATVTRTIACSDRDKPDTYLLIAEFPSWQAAQANDALEVTQRVAEQVAKLAEAPPTFRNLDVVDEFQR